ncbi:MAG: hypothetical protein HW377_767 [Actinobacteria bacterium]|nr:hypothetical protein [Actinomycetota bacterium]MBM2827517.1 hypothetical protein [Actinomycetota bacterium]
MTGGKTSLGVLGVTFFTLLITFPASGITGDPTAPPISPPAIQQGSVPGTPHSPVLPQAIPPVTPPVPTPVIAAPPNEKEPDRVLSHSEVDRELSKNREAEKMIEPQSDFFVSAQGGSERRDADLYAGLMGRIDKFIRYFQTTGKNRFELYLERSGKYANMMRGILARYGLPGDLIYLALIESGFSPKAYSVASAAGPWQFIAGTGKRYGLRIDWWTDERRDYEKSTHAAASYLKDLYDMFESWPLAAAAYNAGEWKIIRAVDRYNSGDFVELIRHRYLKQETKDYVPKMIAALTIAKEPEKFGFADVKYEAPLEFDKVTVPGGTELMALGRVIGVPYESLREWNPELRRFCTPPNQEAYELRLPKGYGRIAGERMEEIRSEAKVTFLLHTVKKGETLSSIADRYHTSPPVLQELNGMKKPALSRTARLVIPVAGLSAEEAVSGKEISAEQVEAAFKRFDVVAKGTRKAKVRKKGAGAANNSAAPGGKRELRHVIRKGDSLSKIALVYGVTPQVLSARNHLKQGQVLSPGRVLIIPLES